MGGSGAIRLEASMDANALVLAFDTERPLLDVRIIGGVQNAVMVFKIIGMSGAAVPGEIGRCAKYHDTQFADASGLEPGVGHKSRAAAVWLPFSIIATKAARSSNRSIETLPIFGRVYVNRSRLSRSAGTRYGMPTRLLPVTHLPVTQERSAS